MGIVLGYVCSVGIEGGGTPYAECYSTPYRPMQIFTPYWRFPIPVFLLPIQALLLTYVFIAYTSVFPTLMCVTYTCVSLLAFYLCIFLLCILPYAIMYISHNSTVSTCYRTGIKWCICMCFRLFTLDR